MNVISSSVVWMKGWKMSWTCVGKANKMFLIQVQSRIILYIVNFTANICLCATRADWNMRGNESEKQPGSLKTCCWCSHWSRCRWSLGKRWKGGPSLRGPPGSPVFWLRPDALGWRVQEAAGPAGDSAAVGPSSPPTRWHTNTGELWCNENMCPLLTSLLLGFLFLTIYYFLAYNRPSLVHPALVMYSARGNRLVKGTGSSFSCVLTIWREKNTNQTSSHQCCVHCGGETHWTLNEHSLCLDCLFVFLLFWGWYQDFCCLKKKVSWFMYQNISKHFTGAHV